MAGDARDGRGQLSFEPDAVIEAYEKDVDRTLLCENLRRTVEEHLRELMRLHRFAEEWRRAAKQVFGWTRPWPRAALITPTPQSLRGLLDDDRLESGKEIAAAGLFVPFSAGRRTTGCRRAVSSTSPAGASARHSGHSWRIDR